MRYIGASVTAFQEKVNDEAVLAVLVSPLGTSVFTLTACVVALTAEE